MNELIGSAINGAVIGACASLAVFVVARLRKPKACPDCGEPLPTVRKAVDRICSECGCEMDRKGRKVEE